MTSTTSGPGLSRDVAADNDRHAGVAPASANPVASASTSSTARSSGNASDSSAHRGVAPIAARSLRLTASARAPMSPSDENRRSKCTPSTWASVVRTVLRPARRLDDRGIVADANDHAVGSPGGSRQAGPNAFYQLPFAKLPTVTSPTQTPACHVTNGEAGTAWGARRRLGEESSCTEPSASAYPSHLSHAKKRVPLCRVGRIAEPAEAGGVAVKAALQASSPRRHAHHATVATRLGFNVGSDKPPKTITSKAGTVDLRRRAGRVKKSRLARRNKGEMAVKTSPRLWPASASAWSTIRSSAGARAVTVSASSSRRSRVRNNSSAMLSAVSTARPSVSLEGEASRPATSCDRRRPPAPGRSCGSSVVRIGYRWPWTSTWTMRGSVMGKLRVPGARCDGCGCQVHGCQVQVQCTGAGHIGAQVAPAHSHPSHSHSTHLPHASAPAGTLLHRFNASSCCSISATRVRIWSRSPRSSVELAGGAFGIGHARLAAPRPRAAAGRCLPSAATARRAGGR